MWYPSRGQWIVIWAAFVLALLLWMDAKEFVGVHLFIAIAAVLGVWMLERRRKPWAPCATGGRPGDAWLWESEAHDELDSRFRANDPQGRLQHSGALVQMRLPNPESRI